jgi:tRNA-splicing ligase RtcB
LESIEPEAIEQAKNLASLPFAHHHIALMPDCHSGYGMPIGGVLATKNVVIPNAVGVDIGCGMLSVKTGLGTHVINPERLRLIFGRLRESIPVGFEHHKEAQDEKFMPEDRSVLETDSVVRPQYMAALKQVGTLGGGNHFIEFQEDEDGALWFTVHSGSRNLGHRVASWYNDRAKALCDRWFTSVPAKWDLAFLPIGEDLTTNYITDMKYCVEFAKKNRELMARRISAALYGFVPFTEEWRLDIAHNYVRAEFHGGQNLWVHRKGATSAKNGEFGIIPGSQGTHTFIVRGLGNPESFSSCSHGAGRVMGRKQAQRSLNLKEEQKKMEAAGVMVHGLRSSKDLDEAPGSYKSIDWVMSHQTDLVEVVHTLRPLAVMKG